MRLYVLYHRDGTAGKSGTWDKTVCPSNPYVKHILEDGYGYLAKYLTENNILDEIHLVIEGISGQGSIEYQSGVFIHVVPFIEDIEPLIQDGDVILVRCGFKNWIPMLTRLYEKNNNWILFYRAAWNNQRWNLWHVILEDVDRNRNILNDKGQYVFPYVKPVNPSIFAPLRLDRKYDVCIGASMIHDKKGQWLGIETLIAYKELFPDEHLTMIMPGSMRHSSNTNNMIDRAISYDINILMPGFVTRPEMCKLYNQSRVLLVMSSCGQNDRSALEATYCGTPVILRNKLLHPPYMESFAVEDDEPETIAIRLHELIKTTGEHERSALAGMMAETQRNGMTRFSGMLEYIKKHPQPCPERLYETIK